MVNFAFIFYLLVVSSCARGQLLGMTSLLSLWNLEVKLRSAGSQQVLCPHPSCWPCQTVWLSMADLELNWTVWLWTVLVSGELLCAPPHPGYTSFHETLPWSVRGLHSNGQGEEQATLLWIVISSLPELRIVVVKAGS